MFVKFILPIDWLYKLLSCKTLGFYHFNLLYGSGNDMNTVVLVINISHLLTLTLFHAVCCFTFYTAKSHFDAYIYHTTGCERFPHEQHDFLEKEKNGTN